MYFAFGYSGKLLNIINDEHVDCLVEADEIIEVVWYVLSLYTAPER